MTQALISHLQTGYNAAKSYIAKQRIELEIHLETDQLSEIKDSLSTGFKQMVPAFLDKKRNSSRDLNQRKLTSEGITDRMASEGILLT